MDPIYLYSDEVEGAYRITVGRSGDYIKTPLGNDLESPNEDLIEEMIYELQKFESIEIKDSVIQGDQIEGLTLYHLLCTQIDFYNSDRKFEPEEFENYLSSDFITNLSPGPEKVDQIYQWRSVISFLEERGYDFYKLQYYNNNKKQLDRISKNIINDINLSDSCEKSIFFNLSNIYKSPITSWVFTFSELSGYTLGSILSQTVEYFNYVSIGIDDKDLSEEEQTRILKQKKREIFDECQQVIQTCSNFKKLSKEKIFDDIKKVRFFLSSGESDKIEFKQSLSLDTKKDKKEKYIEDEVLKTIVAFFNKDGGTLLVGVDDGGNATGIDDELKRLFKGSTDKFLLHFKNIRKSRIGLEYDRLLDIGITKYSQKRLLLVECKKSDKACFLDKNYFYVRTSPANELLEGPKLLHYVNAHFKSKIAS